MKRDLAIVAVIVALLAAAGWAVFKLGPFQ